MFLKKILVEARSDNVGFTFVSIDDKGKVSVAKLFHESVSHVACISSITYVLLRECVDLSSRTTLANKNCREKKSIDLPSTL